MKKILPFLYAIISAGFGILTLYLSTSESTEAVVPGVPQKNEESLSIQLNHGKKWQVNIEMKPYITEEQNLLNAYDKGNYKMLAKQLK